MRVRERAERDSANWLSMYNAEHIIVDRKTECPKTVYVPHAAVSVSAGGIQPGILRRALGTEHRESGLAARLLLTCPPRKPKAWTEADIDPAAEAELVRVFDRLYELEQSADGDGECRPVLVHMTAEAKVVWTTYYNDHALEQADLTGDLSAAWSKLEESAARLALIVHLVRYAAGNVGDKFRLDEASMTAGVKLANWFKGETRRVYAMMDESAADQDQRRLIEWLDRKGGSATDRAVRQGCRWIQDTGAADAAWQLAKAGWVRGRTSHRLRPAGDRPACSTCRRRLQSTKPPTTDIETEGFVDVDKGQESNK